MRTRYERRLRNDVTDVLERLQRLEIHHGLMVDDLEHLKARQQTLATRLGGALGGRPRAGAQGAPAPNGQLTLADIPPGDKRALRAYFKLNPTPKEQ